MKYHIVNVTELAQNCSIIWCKTTNESAIVDPGGDISLIKDTIDNLNLKPTKILLTHCHFDHIGAVSQLKSIYQTVVIGPNKLDNILLESLKSQSNLLGLKNYKPFVPNQWLQDGDFVKVGLIKLEVLHCMGHTPGHVVFFNRIGKLLISGDVIFRGSIGRTDLLQGNKKFLMQSIKNKLLPLGDDITFIPGHGPISTLGYEIKNNPFLQENN